MNVVFSELKETAISLDSKRFFRPASPSSGQTYRPHDNHVLGRKSGFFVVGRSDMSLRVLRENHTAERREDRAKDSPSRVITF